MGRKPKKNPTEPIPEVKFSEFPFLRSRSREKTGSKLIENFTDTKNTTNVKEQMKTNTDGDITTSIPDFEAFRNEWTPKYSVSTDLNVKKKLEETITNNPKFFLKPKVVINNEVIERGIKKKKISKNNDDVEFHFKKFSPPKERIKTRYNKGFETNNKNLDQIPKEENIYPLENEIEKSERKEIIEEFLGLKSNFSVPLIFQKIWNSNSELPKFSLFRHLYYFSNLFYFSKNFLETTKIYEGKEDLNKTIEYLKNYPIKIETDQENSKNDTNIGKTENLPILKNYQKFQNPPNIKNPINEKNRKLFNILRTLQITIPKSIDQKLYRNIDEENFMKNREFIRIDKSLRFYELLYYLELRIIEKIKETSLNPQDEENQTEKNKDSNSLSTISSLLNKNNQKINNKNLKNNRKIFKGNNIKNNFNNQNFTNNDINNNNIINRFRYNIKNEVFLNMKPNFDINNIIRNAKSIGDDKDPKLNRFKLAAKSLYEIGGSFFDYKDSEFLKELKMISGIVTPIRYNEPMWAKNKISVYTPEFICKKFEFDFEKDIGDEFFEKVFSGNFISTDEWEIDSKGESEIDEEKKEKKNDCEEKNDKVEENSIKKREIELKENVNEKYLKDNVLYNIEKEKNNEFENQIVEKGEEKKKSIKYFNENLNSNIEIKNNNNNEKKKEENEYKQIVNYNNSEKIPSIKINSKNIKIENQNQKFLKILSNFIKEKIEKKIIKKDDFIKINFKNFQKLRMILLFEEEKEKLIYKKMTDKTFDWNEIKKDRLFPCDLKDNEITNRIEKIENIKKEVENLNELKFNFEICKEMDFFEKLKKVKNERFEIKEEEEEKNGKEEVPCKWEEIKKKGRIIFKK